MTNGQIACNEHLLICPAKVPYLSVSTPHSMQYSASRAAVWTVGNGTGFIGVALASHQVEQEQRVQEAKIAARKSDTAKNYADGN